MRFDHLKLKILEGSYKYVLLESSADLLEKFGHSTNKPIAILKSPEELSAIIPSEMEIHGITKVEHDWVCMKIVGEMPFGTVQGLIAEVSGLLAANKMGVCVVSTFLTDWFFLRSKNLDSAVTVLANAGWQFEK